MQDNPAVRSPKVYQPRTCADCPASFAPANSRQARCPVCRAVYEAGLAAAALDRKNASKRAGRAAAKAASPPAVCSVEGCGETLRRNNTIGRCQEHRYVGEGMGICGVEGCGARLRRDNRIGFCEAHKFPTSRVPARYCASEGCGNTLRIDNTGGYCPEHYSENEERQREYHDRQNARARALNAARPDERLFCSVEGCENRLRSDNTTGRCREHHYLLMDLALCSVDGCESRLMPHNTIGRCFGHRGLYWSPDARKCGEPGCGKTLHSDNTTGFCHKHRKEYLGTRNRAYYAAHQDELVEYARLYREVYAEEHRAYSREHYAANGRISPEAQRAAAARRRQRAEHGMDEVDRLLSAEYRKAIRNDPCFYCGAAETHHVDHFFPLAKGGTDAWFNLVRACQDCNLSKFTKCGTAFLLREGLLAAA